MGRWEDRRMDEFEIHQNDNYMILYKGKHFSLLAYKFGAIYASKSFGNMTLNGH